MSILGLNLVTLQSGAARPPAEVGSAREVIDIVNQLRAANGLAPYKVDSALMAAAQEHSQWMAETGTASHTGAGGSSPASRAAATGYSGGGVVENIMSGNNLTAAQAVQWWQNDGLHLDTLLSTAAEDAGAGEAFSGDKVYYTLVVGRKGGSSDSGSGSGWQQPTASGGAAPASTPPNPEIMITVEIVTPRPDGSIVHVVKEGQTLWDIATAYKVRLADLYALNGLTDQSVIFPGEQVLIQLADKTVTPTLPVTGAALGTPLTVTPESSSTRPAPTNRPATNTPTRMAGVAATQSASPEGQASEDGTQQPTPAATAIPPGSGRKGADPLLILIGALAVVGMGLVLAGSLLKRGT